MPTQTTRPTLTLAGSLLTLFGLCGTSAAQHVGRRAAHTVYGAFSKLRGHWTFAQADTISGTVEYAAAQFAGLDGATKKSPQACAGPVLSFTANFHDAVQPWLAKGSGGVSLRVRPDGGSEESILRGAP